MKLSQQQIDFFETFGFIKFPGLLKDKVSWITEEYENVFPMFENNHDGTQKRSVVPFIDQREKLSGLLDDPRIYGICTTLVGDDFNYMGSDGNYYTGNTLWHPDGHSLKRKHIKIAFYLDQLDGSNGALRVIPGSHRIQDQYGRDVLAKVMKSEQFWGISGNEVPAQVLDVVPGDIVVFDHNTFHSSWGGNTNRRMFTMNLSNRFQEEDIAEMRDYMIIHSHFRRDHFYGRAMLETAGPQRRLHLEQISAASYDYFERTKHLPELVLK